MAAFVNAAARKENRLEGRLIAAGCGAAKLSRIGPRLL